MTDPIAVIAALAHAFGARAAKVRKRLVCAAFAVVVQTVANLVIAIKRCNAFLVQR
jgi:hypothetical protein